MDNQSAKPEVGGNVSPFIKSSPRERVVAGVLTLVYLTGWALTGYAYSIRIEDHWPVRLLWVASAAWFAVMLVLPLVVVLLFFGGPTNPAWLRVRFSFRALLILLTLAAVGFGLVVWAAEFFNPVN